MKGVQNGIHNRMLTAGIRKRTGGQSCRDKLSLRYGYRTGQTVPPVRSRNDHQREEIIVKMVDLEREINDDVDRLVDLKREMMEAIREVPDPDCRVFLEKRFLGKMRAKDIANERHYNENWAMTEQRKALGMIEPILRKKGIIDQDF